MKFRRDFREMGKYLCILLLPLVINSSSAGQNAVHNLIQEEKVAKEYYGNDYHWYLDNIPFFGCSDTTIQNVYYYRWKLYKAHLKDIGPLGYIVTDYLNETSRDSKPYNSLNDAASFHIYEGRWLKNRQYLNNYIDFMYKHGGNDRHFSESIGDAVYAYYLVNSDKKFIESQLPYMVEIFKEWYDQYDYSKGLYYIKPLRDATEYTISSIDGSGGKDGFLEGDAFRPSINSYMYGNALAIKKIALLAGDKAMARMYGRKAQSIKKNVLRSLWNSNFSHFMDRYKENNRYVSYWHFIRGRELIGYAPWDFDLPDDNPKYVSSWKHVMDTTSFYGRYGLRTDEPDYQYYMKQFRYDQDTGLKDAQSNGPSSPFQTTEVLIGMANLLNNYRQNVISKADYLKILHQYALQHYNGKKLNLLEDYDPDRGRVIVDIPNRSEHYNHSEFNNLIITGLVGLRPRSDNTLVVNPLIPVDKKLANHITWFCLQNVLYHGYNVTIMYDKNGKKFGLGAGLSIWVDGKRVVKNAKPGEKNILLSFPYVRYKSSYPIDYAVNITGHGYPKAYASYTYKPDKPMMAIDGRVWYFPNVKNWWSCYGSENTTDWFSLDLGEKHTINEVDLFLFSDEKGLKTPKSYSVSYWKNNVWEPVNEVKYAPPTPLGNTKNKITFHTVTTSKIKVTFKNAGNGGYTALSEIKVYKR